MSSLSGLDSETDDEIVNESMVFSRYVGQLLDSLPFFPDMSMVSVSMCIFCAFSPLSKWYSKKILCLENKRNTVLVLPSINQQSDWNSELLFLKVY